MYRDEHLRIITEVRALTYEADELRRQGGERALGMFAAAQGLSELCHPGVAPDDLLTEEVSARVDQLREYIMESESVRHATAIEQGKQTRPYPLPYPELIQLADVAASNAYLTYARHSGWRQSGARQQPGSCSPMFYLMQHELRKVGVETQHMWWFEAGNNHHFLRTVMPDGDIVIMDPTWQQYLPEGTDYSQHPNVFIAPHDRTSDILSHHGVPESWHRAWQNAKVDPRAENNNWHWSRELERAFAIDPWIPALPLDQQRFYTESI